MISISRPPINVSNEIIRSYYYLEFIQSKNKNSGIVIDDCCYELMFVKEQNVKFINGDNKSFLIAPSFTLINPKPPFRFEFSKTFSVFSIKLQPWMNTSYIPISKGKTLNLNTLYHDPINVLQKNLFNSKSIDKMVEHAEEFLMTLNISLNERTELVKNICKAIYDKSGNITVNEIAVQFDMYRQKLNQLFKEEVKYTLKTFINNIRIRACISYKLKNPEISLTEIGYRFGYFDQAHFTHSFKKACGVSPSEYVNNLGYSFRAEMSTR